MIAVDAVVQTAPVRFCRTVDLKVFISFLKFLLYAETPSVRTNNTPIVNAQAVFLCVALMLQYTSVSPSVFVVFFELTKDQERENVESGLLMQSHSACRAMHIFPF